MEWESSALPIGAIFPRKNHLPLSDKWLNYAKLSYYTYTAHSPHTLIKTRQIIQFLILHQNWIFCICLNCLIISVDRIVSFLLLLYLSSGNRIWTGNLRVMGPAIFHLIISRDWKRQIWTAPHAPRARVLPLYKTCFACFNPATQYLLHFRATYPHCVRILGLTLFNRELLRHTAIVEYLLSAETKDFRSAINNIRPIDT